MLLPRLIAKGSFPFLVLFGSRFGFDRLSMISPMSDHLDPISIIIGPMKQNKTEPKTPFLDKPVHELAWYSHHLPMFFWLPYGYLAVCHGKSPFFIGKPSISMSHGFHSYVTNNQRVYLYVCCFSSPCWCTGVLKNRASVQTCCICNSFSQIQPEIKICGAHKRSVLLRGPKTRRFLYTSWWILRIPLIVTG